MDGKSEETQKIENKEEKEEELPNIEKKEEKEDEFHDCEDTTEGQDDEGVSVLDNLADDFVDEVNMKEEEATLTEEQLKDRFEKAKSLKEEGNQEFKEESFEKSIKSYTKALLLCPLNEKDFRAILYANRSAAKIKHGAKDSALLDCTKSLENKENYMKSLVRRAMLYEELEKLDEALEDYKKIYELDHSNKYAFEATQRLPGQIHERNEKLKTEMMGKLKDFGNLVLKPFGLSTESFNLQPTEAGGYTLNFKK